MKLNTWAKEIQQVKYDYFSGFFLFIFLRLPYKTVYYVYKYLKEKKT